jgi:hypothetical protein
MLFWEDGDDSLSVKKYMIQYSLTDIVFSKWLGFQGNKIIIDDMFDFVDEIHIIDSNILDISFIYKFPNVVNLNIQNLDKTKIDFSCFEKLEKLFLTWRGGIINLFDKKSLISLKLDRFKEKLLEVDLLIEELWIINSSVENLFSLSKLNNLKTLRLANLRNLEDSLWLKELKNLEDLSLDSCKKMSHAILDNISGLYNLKKLFFSKAGNIPTLKPIESLGNLEIVGFIENSKIVDGDLMPLSKLPNLKEIHPKGLDVLLQKQLQK